MQEKKVLFEMHVVAVATDGDEARCSLLATAQGKAVSVEISPEMFEGEGAEERMKALVSDFRGWIEKHSS